jgi:hypothetical protein
MFAVVPFFELARSLDQNAFADPGRFAHRQVASFLTSTALAALLFTIVVRMLRHPYDIQRYRMAQFLVAAGALGAVALAVALVQANQKSNLINRGSATPSIGRRRAAVLSVFPILALIHLSMGVRDENPIVRDASLRNYLQ